MAEGFEYQNGFLWLTTSDIVQGMNILEIFSWQYWYAYSLYFSVNTTVSCGYGNLTARNPQQVLLVLICILINVSIFSYFTGSIIAMIADYNWKVHYRREEMSKITKAMYDLKLKSGIRRKIRFYMEKIVHKPLEHQ